MEQKKLIKEFLNEGWRLVWGDWTNFCKSCKELARWQDEAAAL